MSRASLHSLNFPVAMRKNVYGDDVTWNSIFAEEEFTLEGRDYKVLQAPSSTEIRGCLNNILILPTLEHWHLIITLTVIVNYIMGMFCFYFVPERLLFFMCFYAALDAVYFFNLLLILVHRYWKKIQQKYQVKSKNLIILDVISLLPQEGLVGLVVGFSHPLVYYCRFVTFIRFYRVTILFSEILRSVRNYRCGWFLVQYLILFSVALHAAVCIWYSMGCKENCHKIQHWTAVLREGFLPINTVGGWYLICLYISLTLMSNVGFGDFFATTLLEGLFFIIVSLGGFLLINLLIAALGVQLINLSCRRSKFTYDLQNIKEVLHKINASPELSKQLLDYYEVLWRKKSGIDGSPALYDLPSPLRMELMYDINIAHLQNSLLLKNQPEPLLRKISLLIKHVFLLPGDVFFHQGVVKGKLVFIASGVLEILSEEDDESPIISFKAGTVLGEAALLMSVPAKATVKAAKYTELQVIGRQDFMRMMLDHRDTSAELRANIADRLKRAMERVTSVKDHVVMNILVSNTKDAYPIKLLKDHLTNTDAHQQQTPEEIRAMQGLNDRMLKVLSDTSTSHTSSKEQFDTACSSLYKLSENVTMIEPPRVCLTQTFPWILDPDSNLARYWDLLVNVIQIILCFIFPYFIIYERNLPESVSLYGILADGLYLIDIYLRCTTAVVLRNRTIRKFKNILDYEMRFTSFYVDVFSLFPLEILSFGFYLPEDKRDRVYYLMKLNRILRVWRLHKLFSNLENQLFQNIVVLTFLKYGAYLILGSFWAGVLLYATSCLYPTCTKGSWFYFQMINAIHQKQLIPCYEHPVALSTYFGVNSLMLVGYGDVLPNNNWDIIVVNALMLMGIFLICYHTSQLTAGFALTEKFLTDYKENLTALGRFLEQNNLMHSLYKRVIVFFRLQWSYDKGTGRDFLMASAPTHLRSALQSTELKNALAEIPLFQMVDVDFLMLIAEGARIQVLPAHEVIAYVGDMSREMHILLNGHCQVLGDSGAVLSCLGPGAQLGVLEMTYGIPKRYTAKTITNCKIITVDYRLYMQAMSMFPAINQETKVVMDREDLVERVNNVNLERMKSKAAKIETKKKLTLMSYVNCQSSFFKKSFILTKRQCKRSGKLDNYWAPFKKMGKLQFLGLLLLPIAIHPEGPFIRMWCCIRFISILTVCFFCPFYIAVAPFATNLYWVMLATNVCAYVDVYLLMHLAYYNSNGILITHPKYTARNYLTHSFIVDFLAVFPFMLFVKWEDPGHNEGHDPIGHIVYPHVYHCSWQINTLLQFHRLPQMFSNMEKDLSKNTYVIKFLKFMPMILILVNLMASLIYGIHCNYKFSTTRHNASASELVVFTNNTVYYGYLRCSTGAWLDKSLFATLTSPLDIYTVAVYWVTSTFSGIGVGDLAAHSKYSMYIVIITILVGKLLLAYMYADLATGRLQISNVMSEYQANLKDLMTFLKHESVDAHWQRKLFKYFEYVWKRTSGMRSQELCQKLNTALMEDTVVFLYENTLREVPLFETVEKSFIRVIAKHLTEQYFRKGDTVIRSYDVQSNIYIIYRGKVEVLSSCNEMIACMGPGGLFGNIRQVHAGCSTVSIIASRNLDLLVVSSETFYNVIKEYPKIARNMNTLLETVTDYIMPSTIIDDDDDYSAAMSSASSNASYKVRGSTSTNETAEENISILKRSSVSTGTSHGTYQSEKQGLETVKQACNIFLPWKWFKFAIFPGDIILKIKDVLVLMVSYYNIITILYAFVTKSTYFPLLISSLILESVFYFKILLKCHEAYMDRYGNYAVQFKKIARHNFMHPAVVFWDIVPNLPIELFCFIVSKKERLFVLQALRLLHLLRLKYMLDYFAKMNKRLMTHLTFNQGLKLIVFATISIHIFSCAWLMIACPFNQCLQTSWAGVFNFTQHSPLHRYFVSTYYIVSLGTTGIGDIYPSTITEVVFSIFTILIFRFLTALIIGNLVTAISISSRRLTVYEFRIFCLRDFLQNQNLSGHQMEKLWGYLKSLWAHEKGQHIPAMLKYCPYVLRCDIMSVMFGQHLHNSFLFQGLNESLLRQLVVCLNRVVFFPGNYIVQHGDTDKNMYFIHSGEVSVLTVHPNLTETQHELLTNQDMFGLAQGLYHGLPHHFSYRANTKVSILVLNLDSWSHMLKYFPRDKELIYYRAQTMYVKV